VPQIRVDGEVFESPNPPKTFDDVLLQVEPTVLARARVVTAVRFNGVDEPAFRDPEVRTRALTGGTTIALDTGTPLDIARAALGDAGRLIPSMTGAAAQLALQLRTAEAPRLAAELGPLAEGLTLLVALVQTAEDWARAAGVPHAPWLGAEMYGISEAIDAIQAAQGAADWLSVADTLHYDLCPALEAWREHLAAEALVLERTEQETHGSLA
jgi:hypothetical protein